MSVFGSERIKSDLIWYLAGAVLPSVVMLIRTPVFTRHFSPLEYGQYTIVYLTFLYLSALKIEWIRTSIWRYYLKYKRQKKLGRFWNTVSSFFLLSSFLVGMVAVGWYLFSANAGIRAMILWGAGNIITQELVTILLITKRIEGRSGYYNIVNSSKTGLTFGLLLLLAFQFDVNITSFFIAPVLVNLVYLLVLLPGSQFRFFPGISTISRSDAQRFVYYGFAGTVSTLSTFLLTTADRWIINYFWGLEKTGIYNQTFMLGQMSIMAFITILNASLNPYLINNLEREKNKADYHTGIAYKWFFYIVFPITVYVTIYPNEIANILLGEEFREAWHVIPFIAIAFFIEGTNHFSTIKLKFINRLKYLYTGVVVALIINVVLNIYVVQHYSYFFAAYSTVFSYLFLFCYYYLSAKSNYFHRSDFRRFYAIIIIVLSIQVALHILFRNWIFTAMSNHLAFSVAEGVVFAATYVLVTFRISPLREKNSVKDKYH